MLLALASVVFRESESLGLVTVVYCLRFETSLFVASYDSQGHGGGIRSRLHTGEECRDFIYNNSVRTSQETHYVSATETNRSVLFGETVSVYCENHMEHTNTLWVEYRNFIYKNPVRISQETHYVSATETSRLMLFGETLAVYYENHTEHTMQCVGRLEISLMKKVRGTYRYQCALKGLKKTVLLKELVYR
jgi:hypothetical protein